MNVIAFWALLFAGSGLCASCAHYQNENPRISVKPHGELSFIATGHFHGQKQTSVEFLKLDQMQTRSSGPVTVFVQPGETEIALRVLQRTKHQAKIVKRVTGLEPQRWGVVIVPKLKKLSRLDITEIDLTKKFNSIRVDATAAFSFDQIMGDGTLEQNHQAAGYASLYRV